MPDISTEEVIASTALSSANTVITFSSIPQTYTDLRLVVSGTTDANDSFFWRLNSDSGSNYSRTTIQTNGSTTTSSSDTNASAGLMGMSTSYNPTITLFSTLDIFNYKSSFFKTILETEPADKNGSGTMLLAVYLWRGTAAVTTVSLLTTGTTNFKAGTIATLYGIL